MRALLVLLSMLAGVVVISCAPAPQLDVAITPIVYSALPAYGYNAYAAAPAVYTPYAYPFSYAYGYSYYVV